MFDLDEQDIYVPNTEVMRKHLESLNYNLTTISLKVNRKPVKYNSICFMAWVKQFERLKQTSNMYYCRDKPNLTEDQSIFVFSILHVCPDYQTFKEAVEQYINSNP